MVNLGAEGGPEKLAALNTFIAHARTDLPAALEALEEAQKRRDEWRVQAFRLLPSDTDEDDMGELWSEFAVEAQGKLEAIRKRYRLSTGWETARTLAVDLDRILRGSKEGNE